MLRKMISSIERWPKVATCNKVIPSGKQGAFACRRGSLSIARPFEHAWNVLGESATQQRHQVLKILLAFVTFLLLFFGLARVVSGQVFYEAYRPVVVTAYSPVVAYQPVVPAVRARVIYEPTTTYRPVTSYEPVTAYRPVTSYVPTVAYSPVVTYERSVVAPVYAPTVVARPLYVPGEPIRNFFRARW